MGFISIIYQDNILTIENSVYSSQHAIQEINDLYLKNVISILDSVGYKLTFDDSNSKILKIQIIL